MNAREFAALKAGDKIENPVTGSRGEVVKTTDSAVFIVWGVRSAAEREFGYSFVSTAWMQWSKVDVPSCEAVPGTDSGNS